MKYKNGIIAGNFDVIHPGYIKMFKEMESVCENIIILLHADPTKENPKKLKPILTVEERIETLEYLGIKYIHTYNYEFELLQLIENINPDVRFLGSDYKGKAYTGYQLNIPIHWIDRSVHSWSTTRFKRMLAKSVLQFHERTGIELRTDLIEDPR